MAPGASASKVRLAEGGGQLDVQYTAPSVSAAPDHVKAVGFGHARLEPRARHARHLRRAGPPTIPAVSSSLAKIHSTGSSAPTWKAIRTA